MLVKPFLNMIYTFFAPHRRADVAQSNAVSPTPSTITFPYILGNLLLQVHIPAGNRTVVQNFLKNLNMHNINSQYS